MAVLARRIDAVIPRLSGLRFPPGDAMARRMLRLLLRLLLREEECSDADSSDSKGRRSTADVVACPPATDDAPNN